MNEISSSSSDDLPDLIEDESAAKELKERVMMIDKFLEKEITDGKLSNTFESIAGNILIHGHCHQKALSSMTWTQKLLSFPANYSVETIPSGCCGMAGSFGYEAEHFEVSQQIGELVLFPAVRNTETETIIAAPGTSCRHQIADGTGRKAMHPVEILFEALNL